MDFSYSSYIKMIYSLDKHGYLFTSYHDWAETEQCVIL